MSSFSWTSSLTEKFVELRLQNDHLFQRKFRSWSSFRKILIREGFPKDITNNIISKKWGNLLQSYQSAIKNEKAEHYMYYDLFEKYKIKPSPMNRYGSWSTKWIKKLIEIRIEHENIFKINPENVNQYEENWSLIERKIKDAGLPVECSVRRMDRIWDTILKKFKLKYSDKHSKDDVKESWTYYNLFKGYFEKYHSNWDISDSDDDMEPLNTLKNNKSKNELDYSVLNSEAPESHDDFQWTSEWTESFIHLRFQNDNLFKKKRTSWNDFRKIMISNGFPETITIESARNKWYYIMQSYRKAVLLDNKNWKHSKLVQKYMENNKFDIFKDWSEKWIKFLIKLRIRNNKFFVGSSIDNDKKWNLLEIELRKAGLPNQCILRNIHFMWISLVKKFKLMYKKKKNSTPEITWPYYQPMQEYFTECEPEFFTQDKDTKCNNDDESDHKISLEYPNMEEQHFVAVKKEFLNYPCRCCLQSSDQVVSLYESFDNVLLLNMFVECTSISVEENTNYPYHLCHPCFNQLNIAYEFRKKCEQSEIYLKSHSNTLVNESKMEIDPSNILAEFNFSDDIVNTHYSDDDEKRPKNKVTPETNYSSNEIVSTHYSDNNDEEISKTEVTSKTNSSNDDEDAVKIKVKNEKPRKTNRGKKLKVRSKNVVTVPIKTESGEIIYKKRYIYKKVCEVCGKSSRNMTEHMRSHSEENTIKCEFCPKTFRYQAGYTTHLKTHSQTPLKICQICGKEFYRNSCYKRHLDYHADERKFSCETCGKTFNSQDILRIHIRIHTGERSYACQICGKTFISKGCLGRHQKVHRK